MTRSAFSFVVLGAALVLLHGTGAHATNIKSWVSNTGSDANPCTFAQPCATLAHTVKQTSPGGEIGILTPGEYSDGGTLVIDRSLGITNDGVGEASVTTSGADNTDFLAGPGDIASLRGLTLDGRQLGNLGLGYISGAALHVQNCVIRNFANAGSGDGLLMRATDRNLHLFVSDTAIYNNGGHSGNGAILIELQAGGGGAEVVLDRVRLQDNIEGLFIDSRNGTGPGVHVIVRDSVMSGNLANGIRALTVAGHAPAFAVVERSAMVSNRQNGILADGPGATLLLNDSSVVRNNAGITTVNSGQLFSYGNNRINNNLGPDGAPTAVLALN